MAQASIILAVISLATISIVAARDPCFTGRGGVHRHGERFTIPGHSHCLRYICWNGNVIVRGEACEVEGQCHPVGSVFEHRCTRYRCEKSNQGSYILYKPEPISSRCRDYRGVCHNPGDIFSFVIGSTYHPKCSCSITSMNHINYRCVSTTRPRRSAASVSTREGSEYLSTELKPLMVRR